MKKHRFGRCFFQTCGKIPQVYNRFLLFLVVQTAVAVALEFGVSDLVAELLAHADVVLDLLQAAGAL